MAQLNLISPKDRPKNNTNLVEKFKKGAFMDDPQEYLKKFTKKENAKSVTHLEMVSRERGDVYDIYTVSIYVKKD